MFYRLRQKWNRWQFARACHAIVDTPPLQIHSAPLNIVSSVSHDDLFMYLVAIKSFYRYVGRGSVVILDDGTLTPHDHRLLREQVTPDEIIALDAVPYSHGRKGVRWGILLTIADLVAENYVIQLDSDTLTLLPVPEVLQALANEQSFTLGTNDGCAIVTMEEISSRMKGNTSPHVQVVAERSFAALRDFRTKKYIRGNSGLAGFAKGAFTRTSAEDFLSEMTTLIGDKWLTRGSYQVSSNVLVANSHAAQVLPIAKYSCVTPSMRYHDAAAFLHFLGQYRFHKSLYVQLARALVREIQSAPLPPGLPP